MDSIQNVVNEIKHLNSEAASLGGALLGAPNPPADGSLLQQQQEIPRSYREFLSICNGWPRFWGKFTLAGIGTADAARMREHFPASCEEQLESLRLLLGIEGQASLEAWETELPRNVLLGAMEPIGTDFIGGYLLFDKPRRGKDGEMAVFVWDLSYGAYEGSYFRNFHAYLVEMRNQVHARVLEMRKSAKKKK